MKKIFYLDDNEELIEILELVLGKDYIIYSRNSAENVTQELMNFKPDLILIDHFIGDNNSEEILNGIKNTFPGFAIPFILVSASHEIAEKAKLLGAAGFIEKPSSISYIKNYVKEFFEK